MKNFLSYFWIIGFLIFAVIFAIKGEFVVSVLFCIMSKLESIENKLNNLVKK